MKETDKKQEGVFEFCNEETEVIYFGRSTSLDSIIRTTKSKLKKNKFHNKSLQMEYNKHGLSAYDIEKHFPEKGETVLDLLLRLEESSLRDNWKLHNKLDVLEVSSGEIDKYGVDDLSGFERDFIKLVIKKIDSIDIDYLTSLINQD